MQRRDFLRSGTAAVCVSAVPVVPVAASTSGAAVRPGLFAWAVAAARARDIVTEGVLADSLKVPMGVARVLMARLEAQGVVYKAANGSARVVAPVFRASGWTGSGVSLAQAKAARSSSHIKDVLERVAGHDPLAKITSSGDDPAQPEASGEARSAE